MSIFGSILSRIFPASHPAVANAGNTPATAPVSSPGAASGAAPAPTSTATTASPAVPPGPAGMPPVDVEQVLNALAQKNAQKLNWRSSIVDLMKLVDLDSSLGARQQLAGELGYTGDKTDSASMNIWLHKQVMNQLAQNGGHVPEDLRN